MKPKNLATKLGAIVTETDETKQEAFRREIHKFIDGLVGHIHDPSQWPLSPHEQRVFVKSTLYLAQKIAKSEPYMAETVRMAARDLAMAS